MRRLCIYLQSSSIATIAIVLGRAHGFAGHGSEGAEREGRIGITVSEVGRDSNGVSEYLKWLGNTLTTNAPRACPPPVCLYRRATKK